MNEKILQHPILEHGIRNINFFEGRLLTGEDLREQQNANREHDNRLGKAIGAGIIEGLEVELIDDGADGNTAAVNVKKGLAINAKGEVIGLPKDDIKLALTETGKVININEADFNNCTKLPGSQLLPNGARVYILVMSPAAGYTERASKSGLGDEGVVKGCGSRYIQEGVQFRLVEITSDMFINLYGITEWTKIFLEQNLIDNPLTRNDIAGLSKLRNVLAHSFFGTEQLTRFEMNLFGTRNGDPEYSSYGVLDMLYKSNELNECDVPLAIMYRSLLGIEFIDLWSVRRRVYFNEQSSIMSLVVSSRRRTEMEAMLYQFQDQLDQLRIDHSNPLSVRAKDYFKYLPPAGILPININNKSRYKAETFFNSITHRSIPEYQGSFKHFLDKNPSLMDGNEVLAVLQSSFSHDVIDVTDDVLIWLYYPWQQIQALKSGQNVDQYVLFTVAYMNPVGIPRFDISRWDFSNYTSCGECN